MGSRTSIEWKLVLINESVCPDCGACKPVAGRRRPALPAEQGIAAIRAAVAACPGRVKEVEVDREDGRLIVEVDIAGHNGRTRGIDVGAATGRALR